MLPRYEAAVTLTDLGIFILSAYLDPDEAAWFCMVMPSANPRMVSETWSGIWLPESSPRNLSDAKEFGGATPSIPFRSSVLAHTSPDRTTGVLRTR